MQTQKSEYAIETAQLIEYLLVTAPAVDAIAKSNLKFHSRSVRARPELRLQRQFRN
jgi:hypothetical protein